MEEVDHWGDWIEPHLQEKQYAGFWTSKPKAKDGTCLSWKTEKFTEVEHKIVPFNNGVNQKLVYVLLQPKSDDATKDDLLCILGTHLKAGVDGESVRVEEIAQVREVISTEILAQYPTCKMIFLGDFNSDPDWQVYGKVKEMGFTSCYGNYREPKKLEDGTEVGGTGEPEFTTYKFRQGKMLKHCIDYIWYKQEQLHLTALLEIPDDETVTSWGWLPATCHPSDHFALMAEFGYPPLPQE
eukprot:TRINITY_DN60364_c0_g1_i2.p1 TRINITY_DN60364_c0_g1~~TRINITY_DN60364_c0_g1_i2.p1  ORF type:complete len:240 (+),score=32.29 TRINITY_DN60364_c0_g1_i2:109-828(+)